MRTSTSARRWDWAVGLLLLAALGTAAHRLVVAEWIDHLDIVRILTFLAGVAGLALGHSQFSPLWATAFALAYGLFAVPWQLGLTLEADILWIDRVIVLAGRLNSALVQVAQQEPVQDPLLFLFCVACLSWSLGVHAGYSVTRHAQVWRATLPPGLALLIIQIIDFYPPVRVISLAVYLLLVLLLMARLAYLRRRAQWEQARAHVPRLSSWDFTYVSLLVAMVFVLLAWTIPALADALPAAREAWLQATGPWWEATRERLGNAFASLRGIAIYTVADYTGDLILGSEWEFTDELILTVQSPTGSGAGVRYYWRARVYDHYADGQWSGSVFSTTQPIESTSFDQAFPELQGRRTITFTFTSAVAMANLYTAPQPRWVSHPAALDLAENPDGTVDLGALYAVPPLSAGETYQARSSVASVTVDQLRAAGTDYPRWVTDRYLQVPSTISPRTKSLANALADGLENPYDIAAAATGFLREHITYSESIPPPSSNREPLDWFLFDLRQGFCSYYASAEVILLRTLGIPARMAVGFAQGERQAPSNTYLVHAYDAHTWPEVYFPGVGWVEFEPTAVQPPIVRPSDGQSAVSAEPGDSERGYRDRLEELLALEDEPLPEPSAVAAPDPNTTATLWLFLVLGVMLISLAWRGRRRRGMPPLPVLLQEGLLRFELRPPAALRRWALTASLPRLERAYMELNNALVRLGAAPDSADTPAERAAALTGLLPAAADPTQRLLDEYHATVYGRHPGDPYAAHTAGRSIRNLSRIAWIRRLTSRR